MFIVIYWGFVIYYGFLGCCYRLFSVLFSVIWVILKCLVILVLVIIGFDSIVWVFWVWVFDKVFGWLFLCLWVCVVVKFVWVCFWISDCLNFDNVVKMWNISFLSALVVLIVLVRDWKLMFFFFRLLMIFIKFFRLCFKWFNC